MPKATSLSPSGLAAVLALSLCTAAAPAFAAPNPSTPLAGSLGPLGENVQVLGDAPADSVVRFQVALNLRNAPALSASNAAGHVLTYRQLEQRHLPTVQDYARVVAYLRGAGLTIEEDSPQRLAVEVSGSTAAVTRATGAHFSRIARGKQTFISADSIPSVPTALADVIHGFIGLQPQIQAYRQGVMQPASNGRAPLYPAAFLNAYLAQGLTEGGAGSTTAVIIDTFPRQQDLQTYWASTGVDQTLDNIAFIQTVKGNLPGLSGEESMDVEVASSLAPKSKVRVYASQNLTFAALDKSFQAVIKDIKAGLPITQVSISLGACENAVPDDQITTDDQYMAVISALGASVFASTGDHGSKECGHGNGPNTTSFFATSPNVTAAGGTSLKIRPMDSEPAKESAWTGGGGGLSRAFRRPTYQDGLGYQKRAIPDLSADADPQTGALVIAYNGAYQFGGTSLSAPILAGLMALVNGERLGQGKTGIGLLNPHLYTEVGTTKFRDVTLDDNIGYEAGPGYDLATGLGSPRMEALAPYLVAKP